MENVNNIQKAQRLLNTTGPIRELFNTNLSKSGHVKIVENARVALFFKKRVEKETLTDDYAN